ncbi:MAG: DUF2125 domain-containing protein [Pseudomonadota bacterium]
MRRLTIFVLVLAAIYSAYWYAGYRALTDGTDAQVAQLQDAGWTVAYEEIAVQGYPSRFDTSLTNLSVASPDGAIGFAAPFVQALALAYQPNKVILAFPEEQQVTVAGQDITVQSSKLRASAAVAANAALELDTITAEAPDLRLTLADGQSFAFTDVLAAVRASGPLPNSYDVYANAQNIVLPARLAAFLTAAGGLPEALEVATVDATVVLDKRIDRYTLPDWQADPGKLRGLTLRSLTVRWGELAISGDGEIAVNTVGTPDGTLTLQVTDWQRMLDIALQTGLVPQNARFMALSMGQTLSGGEADLDLPLRFQNGNMSLGPVPLGPAPKFH